MTTGKKVNIDNIIYSSALEASRLLNINHGTIIKRLENPNFKNYIWCDKDMQEKVLNKWINKEKKRKEKIKKPYPTQPVIIDNIEYKSVAIAATQLNLSISKICGRIKNPKFYNYYWKNNKPNYISISNLSYENICDHIIKLMNLSKTHKVDSVKNEPEIWQWIKNQYILKYGVLETENITKIYLVINPKEELICPYGKIKKLKSIEEGLSCSIKCKCVGENRVKTFYNTYGVNSNWGLPKVRESIKNTINYRYKVDFVHQIPNRQEKIENKMQLLYGVKNISNTKYFSNKFKETCNLRYNRNNPKQKHISLEALEILSSPEKLTELIPKHSMQSLANLLGVTISTIWKKYHEFNLEHISFISFRSLFENEVGIFLKENNIQYKPDDRIQLKPLELDFFLSSKNIAIELQGTYWHTDPRKYEANYFHKIYQMTAQEIWDKDKIKSNLCKEKGITLITIWEDDWKQDKENIKQKLLEVLK